MLAKKKTGKGTLSVTVSGSGSYTVTGKGIRKSATVSKSFKVKPGTYTVKAPSGSVKPGKVKVRKGKRSRVTVTFPASVPAPGPSTPAPTTTPSPTPSSPIDIFGAVQRLSTDASGNEADGGSGSVGSEWSPDGTRVVFSSSASNLVPGDTNDRTDVFVKTLATGAIQRISTNANGLQTNGGPPFSGSSNPAWSPDGSKIAFVSFGTDLVPGDTNNARDVFVKTLASGAIQRVSTDSAGLQGSGGSSEPTWSPDGNKVAFASESSTLVQGDTNDSADLFVKNLVNGSIQRFNTAADGTQTNVASFSPAWSPDGSKIAFLSGAKNLVPGDTNGVTDVFTKNLTTSAVERVSTAGNGDQSSDPAYDRPSWSPDSTKVAFSSYANNLVPGDSNAGSDLFVKTLSSGDIQRVSTSANGQQANNADPLGPDSYHGRWSPDGALIAFNSDADNLVPGDTNGQSDVFVKNLASGGVQRASTTAGGTQASGLSLLPEWSPDGKRLTFTSGAPDLVPGKTSGRWDVFAKALG